MAATCGRASLLKLIVCQIAKIFNIFWEHAVFITAYCRSISWWYRYCCRCVTAWLPFTVAILSQYPATFIDFSGIWKQSLTLHRIYIYIYTHTHTHTHRVLHDFRTQLPEVISYVFVMKKVHINMCPILDVYEVMTVFWFPYTPSCEPYRTSWWVIVAYFCQLQTVQFLLSRNIGCRAVHNGAANCAAAGGGIFENQL
jgi:hypothetical protein